MTDGQTQAWTELLLGSQLGPYTPTEHIASGGFSMVFEAIDNRTGAAVALKVLNPGAGPDPTLEFRRERELLAQLRKSSSVVTLLDSSTAQITLEASGVKVNLPVTYHVLELASGCLEELVMERDKISLQERFRLWRGVIKGVHQMHLKGIAHRDLKTSNCLLFVGSSRSTTVPKVSDLGRSCHMGQPAMHQPADYLTGRGDFRFAPPEFLFLQGEDTPRAHKCADLYGLGSLLCEVVTGQGITSLALGFGPEIVEDSIKLARVNRRVDLSALRSRYLPAYRLFEESIPGQIRQPSLRLLKQLCDPVPEMRLPIIRSGKRQVVEEDLAWLLRRADILLKTLKQSEMMATRARATAGSKI
jgi:serine/threonine protein kinase